MSGALKNYDGFIRGSAEHVAGARRELTRINRSLVPWNRRRHQRQAWRINPAWFNILIRK